MPFWLQLTAALSAALASGLMGAAAVPFLRKLRMCEPQEPPAPGEEAAGDRLRPTMGGILPVFGSLLGLTLSFALYLNFCQADRTSVSFQQELHTLICMALFGVGSAAAGFLTDLMVIRRRLLRRPSAVLRIAAVFFVHLVLLLLWHYFTGIDDPTIMDWGFRKVDAGILYYPITASVLTVVWMSASAMEEDTDGVSISTGGILLLCATVILMQQGMSLHALLGLTAAGACMGSLVWNLHPAKCRIGRTGTWWLAGTVIGTMLPCGRYLVLLLLPAVYMINQLPALRRDAGTAGQPQTLQNRMREAGLSPWQRIGLLAGFAIVCGAAAVLAYH